MILGLGISFRMKQSLPGDRITGDRGLSLGRGQPACELSRGPLLRLGMCCRVQQDDVVTIEQARIAFDYDLQVALVPETQPGAAVRQGVSIHGSRSVQRRTHPATEIAIPAVKQSRIETGGLP